ncbi:hypothetical protein [Merismopedia glauca]|uniref:Uncharacterized protein n=1 Tax=Merismopedia glauca CCAP 1448/3 TaxID=1296344 RepID=A0A2T1C5R0_9CYAN|nr:hypothetical protein [Merismopedia glauca]PSB03488.1 hypothetical protein C7B64_08355 [Merismopedia glauca CCAP 1448/3]
MADINVKYAKLILGLTLTTAVSILTFAEGARGTSRQNDNYVSEPLLTEKISEYTDEVAAPKFLQIAQENLIAESLNQAPETTNSSPNQHSESNNLSQGSTTEVNPQNSEVTNPTPSPTPVVPNQLINQEVPTNSTPNNSETPVIPTINESDFNSATDETPKVEEEIPTPVTEDVPTPEATPTTNSTPVTTPVNNGAVKILAPVDGAVLDIPSSAVVVESKEGSAVQLKVNGRLVDDSLIGRTETDSSTKIVRQTWYGVTFREGENILSAETKDGQSVSYKLMVRGAPKEIRVESQETRIPADGKSLATIRGELIDANGNRSNRDALVTLTASAGEFVGADEDKDLAGFQIKARQGQFTAQLRSDLTAQTVRIRASSNDLEAFNQLDFETSLRPGIVTGVVDLRLGARGTDYYGSLREFLPPDEDNRTEFDVDAAIFATGKVGDWLFTGAYNSDRSINDDCSGNSGLIRDVPNCEQYPVYGDSSTSERLARSQDSVFLRLERNRDYVMWGDYDTSEFSRPSQQFSAISRQLHGFKGNYNFGNLQVTGLYGNNVQGFQRDTIAPDGTSGFYFLSRRLLLAGSEEVFIEVEELNRPGTVLERQRLTRDLDYQIDYDRGTLLFKQPILRTDVSSTGEVLVRKIVSTYQFENSGESANIIAGRVQYNFSRELDRESWLAASYFKENQGVRHFELSGADAKISLGANSHIIAEYAHSNNNLDSVGSVSGSAYRVEAQSQLSTGILARAYWRSAEAGFSNNATVSFVPGQTRYGADLTAKLSQSTNFRVQYDHEDNVGVAPRPLNTFDDLFNRGTSPTPGSQLDNSLTTISAGIQQRFGATNLDVDLIHRNREDRLANNPLDSSSTQLRSRLTVPISNTLTFRAQNELSLSSEKDIAYPDRTIFGLEWQAFPGVKLGLNHQFFSGEDAIEPITSFDITGERQIWENTKITARYSVISGFNGLTGQGAIGLNHIWKITPGLKLDLAYEHVFGDGFTRTGSGNRFIQPFAPGQSASSIGLESGDSYAIGLEYTDNPDFKASARYEHRSSSSGNNNVINANVAGKISPALTALFRYQQANSSNQALSGLGDTSDLKLGLAYRDPNDDRFNALLRYQRRKNPSTIPNSILLGSGTGYEDNTLAAEAIYAPNWRWEFYGKYALRNSTTYLADDLVGKSTVSLAQLRATYRPGFKWDVVGEGRWIGQHSTGYSETAWLLEAGYYITPNLRLSAGYVFGRADDADFSGVRSNGGPYLGLTLKVNELFDGFGLQKVTPRQQQESQVQPVANQTPPVTSTPETTNSPQSVETQTLPNNTSPVEGTVN